MYLTMVMLSTYLGHCACSLDPRMPLEFHPDATRAGLRRMAGGFGVAYRQGGRRYPLKQTQRNPPRG
jgi:hypothetical protein